MGEAAFEIVEVGSDNVDKILCNMANEYVLTTGVNEFTSADEVRRRVPSAYGVFHVALDGHLISYCPINRREFDRAAAQAREFS